VKTSKFLLGLTAINLALFLFTLGQQVRPVYAQTETSVLRGRALEIVDAEGRNRASLNVLPGGTSPNGVAYSETVLLRLNTERGRPSVKIGASVQASGLSFAGPTNTKDTYVILEAKGTASSLTLRNEDGREYVVKP
jgi:hypothetical protein